MECRLCNEYDETIDHIVSRCPVVAKSEFIQRHDNAATYMHWKICKAFSLAVTDNWYNHSPETVVSNDQVTLIWDMQVHTGKEIMANKSDIIITDHINNTCHLIDTKIPSDRNVSIMEVGKFSKHEDLEIKVNKMLKMEATTLPLAMCVLGVRKIGMRSAAEKRPGTINIEELQKIALMGTAHILRQVMSTVL